MNIKVWDYKEEYKELREEILEAVDRVFSSGQLILGKEVSNFEKEFAQYCQADVDGVGVNSGTDALFIALKSLEIGAGDEVITVSNTAVPTVAAITSTGAKAAFVDVEERSFLMDPDKLEKAITPKTKCILPVHLYGQCVDMEKIRKISDRYELKILEDCAQATGATYGGKHPGTIGDAAAWSFYPTKLLGGYGDGGMVTTNEFAIAERARHLRMYGMKGRYYAEEHGYNSRLDEVQAAILRVKLKYLDQWLAERMKIAEYYESVLSDTDLILPSECEENKHGWYVYVVRHKQRDKIISELAKHDISVNISYPWPIHIMPAYRYLGYKEGDFPVTEQLASEIFSLPMYPTLSEAKQLQITDSLIEILRSL